MGRVTKIGSNCKKRGGFKKMGPVAKNGPGFKKWGRLQKKAVANREDVEEVVQQAESQSAHIACKAPSVYLEI